MFNRRPLAVMIASALYVGAIATSAGAATPTAGNALHKVPLAQYASTQERVQANAKTGHQPRPGGVNQQLRRAAANKFLPEPNRHGEDTYIVRLRDQPVATYDGRIKGYAATSKRSLAQAAAKQSGLDKWLQKGKDLLNVGGSHKQAVSAYKSYLLGKQNDVLNQAMLLGVTKPVRMQYTDAINGFSVKMTQAQAAAMAQLPGVEYVQRSKLYKLNTDEGPHHIGADQIWAGSTVTTTGVPYQGEGMVVGIIDTGINSDHVSFADIGGDGYDHSNPRGAGDYLGDCANGFASMCNDKLIGVWSWPVITGVYDNDEFQADDWEFWMPRVMKRSANGEDYNGHGSHTAGTVAGNVVHNAPMLGSSIGDGDGVATGFSFDTVSGVAPHANIIAYQVCYPGGGAPDAYSGCHGEAILKAIDQAIQDGVDVINFSIGGGEDFPWTDSAELAFLSAREAGISVAVSAGNSGFDGSNEVMASSDHTSPWLLSVAATTHSREMAISPKTLGSFSGGDTTLEDLTDGTGISPAYSGPIVSAAAYNDELCENPFPANTFTNGEIVVCKRGVNGRVAKAENVAAGGAGGFVLYNAVDWGDGSELVNDVYPIPGMQIENWKGVNLINWLSSGSGHMASISATTITRTINPDAADMLAEFSSRGPSSTYEGHLVPGISAPGVDIIAPYADEHPFSANPLSRDWAFLSGTSMASPHTAGAMTLIRQVHPDWTPAEVQSALQMTAKEVVRMQPYSWAEPEAVSIYRAGSGRVDVAAAVDAGLLMDETGSHFEMANPRNGGDVKQLNLPELVNLHCGTSCSWVRTVKATRDGTWSVTTETGEHSVRLSATPETFTLKAGESKSILIRGEILNSQSASSNSEVEVWGKVKLTATDSSIPESHWPVALKFDHGALPEALTVGAHRDRGSYHLDNLTLPKMTGAQYRAYGLALATTEDITLPIDTDWSWPTYDDNWAPTAVRFVQVPENSARLVVDTIKNLGTTAEEAWRHGDADIWVGFDSNGDGQPQFDDEAICTSTTEVEMDYCNIDHPEAGQYWVVIYNFNTNWSDQATFDSYRIATAVVPGDFSGDLQVTGPSSTDGVSAESVDLNWDLNGAEEGDVLYGAFDVGTSTAPGAVGSVPVKIVRGVNDVSITTSQTRARAGEVIDIALHVVENLSGADRSFDLSTTLPSGLSLVPGSVKISKAQQSGLTVNGNSIRVTGSQLNSEDWERDYLVTTSETDAMCKTTNYGNYFDGSNANGGYVDLEQFGFTPEAGGHADGDASDAVELPLALWWGTGMSLYNNEHVSYPSLTVSPQGWASFDMLNQWNMQFHSKLPDWIPPDAKFGVIWQGDWTTGLTTGTPLNTQGWLGELTGLTAAFTGDEVIIEWDGARSERGEIDWMTWETIWNEMDDRVDAELILNRNVRFGAGEYEVIMAYDNVDFGSQAGNGSIGLQGFHGPFTTYGPLEGSKGVSYAFNDLKSKVKSDLVVCYDYVGPESTQFDLSFQVRVNDDVGATDQLIHFVSEVDGIDNVDVDQLITVNGNLSVAPISNQTVVENTVLEDIQVLYTDNDEGENVITVSGANITAVVHGHEPGDTFDLTPAANFEGTTEVTVTIADQANPNDKVSTSFMLTVTKGTDVDIPSANPPARQSSGGGGGSVGLGALALLALLGRRRKARRN